MFKNINKWIHRQYGNGIQSNISQLNKGFKCKIMEWHKCVRSKIHLIWLVSVVCNFQTNKTGHLTIYLINFGTQKESKWLNKICFQTPISESCYHHISMVWLFICHLIQSQKPMRNNILFISTLDLLYCIKSMKYENVKWTLWFM